MFKIPFTTLLFSSIALLLASCTQEYVVYKPHFYNTESKSKTLGSPVLDSAQMANTIQVFEYYDVVFQQENENTLLIHHELSEDWEEVWNYTTKSNDEEWLATHKPE